MKTLALLVLAISFSWGAKPDIKDISGVYSCKGPGYEGMMAIYPMGESYFLIWSIDGRTQRGVGLRQGDSLSSTWRVEGKKESGIVVYKIEKDGVLRGQYTHRAGAKVEQETLTYHSAIPPPPTPEEIKKMKKDRKPEGTSGEIAAEFIATLLLETLGGIMTGGR